MLSISPASAATRVAADVPAGLCTEPHAPMPAATFGGTRVPTSRGGAVTLGSAKAAVIVNDVPGTPSWSPPV